MCGTFHWPVTLNRVSGGFANTTAPDQIFVDSTPSTSGRRRRAGRRVIVGLTTRSGEPSSAVQRCNAAGSLGRCANPWRHNAVGSAVSGRRVWPRSAGTQPPPCRVTHHGIVAVQNSSDGQPGHGQMQPPSGIRQVMRVGTLRDNRG
jgi:hypothetical protein